MRKTSLLMAGVVGCLLAGADFISAAHASGTVVWWFTKANTPTDEYIHDRVTCERGSQKRYSAHRFTTDGTRFEDVGYSCRTLNRTAFASCMTGKGYSVETNKRGTWYWRVTENNRNCAP